MAGIMAPLAMVACREVGLFSRVACEQAIAHLQMPRSTLLPYSRKMILSGLFDIGENNIGAKCSYCD